MLVRYFHFERNYYYYKISLTHLNIYTENETPYLGVEDFHTLYEISFDRTSDSIYKLMDFYF